MKIAEIIKKMGRYRKEMLELEVRKEELRLKSLQEENKKIDRLIEHKIDISDSHIPGKLILKAY